MKLPAILNGKQYGITLIEILLSVSIILLMVAAMLPLFGSVVVSTQLRESVTEVVQTIRLAREKTMARVGGDAYGVFFAITSIPHTVTLYRGDSYATRDTDYDRVISLASSLRVESTIDSYDIRFAKGTGIPLTSGTTTISSPSLNNHMAIRITPQGVITVDGTLHANFLDMTTAQASLVGASKSMLQGLFLTNTADESVTITEMIVSWTHSGKFLTNVTMDGQTVWSSGGVGSPSGNQNSGVVLDIVDTTIDEQDMSFAIDTLTFTSCMHEGEIDISFVLDDGSVATFQHLEVGGTCS